jgi:hypothetical protein
MSTNFTFQQCLEYEERFSISSITGVRDLLCLFLETRKCGLRGDWMRERW